MRQVREGTCRGHKGPVTSVQSGPSIRIERSTCSLRNSFPVLTQTTVEMRDVGHTSLFQVTNSPGGSSGPFVFNRTLYRKVAVSHWGRHGYGGPPLKPPSPSWSVVGRLGDLPLFTVPK